MAALWRPVMAVMAESREWWNSGFFILKNVRDRGWADSSQPYPSFSSSAARPAAVSSATNDGVSVGNAHDNRRRRSLARRQQTSRRRTRETDERRTRETGERRMTHATVTRDRRMTHDDGSVLVRFIFFVLSMADWPLKQRRKKVL